jgi:hypothetical protein
MGTKARKKIIISKSYLSLNRDGFCIPFIQNLFKGSFKCLIL